MSHEKIYKYFKTMFPKHEEYVETWFPNGKDSIRVRIKSGSDFVFTYHNNYDWCYETSESYIKKINGGAKMNVRFYDSIDKE